MQLAHPETSAPASVASPQRPKLRMVWYKEVNGNRERMVARWIIDP